jgi:uncharacterized protein involved in exopolysaccharide biosynthesis
MRDRAPVHPERHVGTPLQDQRDSFTVFWILAVLLRHRRMLLIVPAAILAIALPVLLILGRTYRADSTFKPQVSEGTTSQLSGLAAQFGFALPGAAIGDPVKYYSEIATSREISEQVINTRYRVRTGDAPGDTLVGTYIDLYKIRKRTPQAQMRSALTKLRNQVIVTNNREAGLVYIRTLAKWPELATQINRRLIDLLDAGNQERRQSQAAAERRFVEGRLEETRKALEAAESEVARFLQANRRYQDSPMLMLEYARLQRRVELRHQVYTTLSLSYEQASIDEVRNTPLLILIDSPEGSARPYGSLGKDAFIWFLIGCVLAILGAMTAEYLAGRRQAEEPDFTEFRREASAALRGLGLGRRTRGQG